jgi:hypothetical protein
LTVPEICKSLPCRGPLKAHGTGSLEVLASTSFIAQLMAQNLRHPGLFTIYGELLSHSVGSKVYVRTVRAFVGRTLKEIEPHYRATVILGICRESGDSLEPLLNPPESIVRVEADRLVFLAESYEDCEPASPVAVQVPIEFRASVNDRGSEPTSEHTQRVLVVGWDHKIPSLLSVLDRYAGERFHATSLSNLTPGGA